MQLPEPLAGAARGPDRVVALPWASPPGTCRKTVKRDKQDIRRVAVHCELAGGQYGGARHAGRALVAAGLASGTGGGR
jgi:hypothetical protein